MRALALKLEGGVSLNLVSFLEGSRFRYSLLPEPHGTPVLWLSSLL